ncbi:MAG TPA: DUF6754 domain-containing protein [Candidatus Eisenbacteria bacterium]|nr:DUF6754 domain-containing protein [Candidatus Eisenbacteria bacterium]
MKSVSVTLIGLFLAANAFAAPIDAPATPPPDLPIPQNLVAKDKPGDSGGSVVLTWTDPVSLPAGADIEVLRAEPPAYDLQPIDHVAAGKGTYTDTSAKDGVAYRYGLRTSLAATDSTGAVSVAAATGAPVVSEPVSSHDNWFKVERTNSFIASILFVIIILGSIQVARSGKEIFIRRIAGLNAIDEAIGRATEIGKKVMYIPGIQSMDDIQTVASVAILGHVARSTARYGTDLEVPNKDPLTFASAREVVRAAYLEEGRPDLFREEMVNYVTYDQFAFTAAVSAKMTREKPAAIFLVGYFFAESLILAETGQSTGAIQIAGQADPTQLPFFVATCDYTLIGEELYAASAYLSREPVLLGSIRGQDIAKGILILIAIAGIVLASVHLVDISPWIRTK